MKTVNLKVIKENIAGRDTFLTTYDLLKMVINNPKEGGFNVDEMIKRLRLLEKLDAHKEIFTIEEAYLDNSLSITAELSLEDDDYNDLKELLKSMKWGVISQAIVDLTNEFK